MNDNTSISNNIDESLPKWARRNSSSVTEWLLSGLISDHALVDATPPHKLAIENMRSLLTCIAVCAGSILFFSKTGDKHFSFAIIAAFWFGFSSIFLITTCFQSAMLQIAFALRATGIKIGSHHLYRWRYIVIPMALVYGAFMSFGTFAMAVVAIANTVNKAIL